MTVVTHARLVVQACRHSPIQSCRHPATISRTQDHERVFALLVRPALLPFIHPSTPVLLHAPSPAFVLPACIFSFLRWLGPSFLPSVLPSVRRAVRPPVKQSLRQSVRHACMHSRIPRRAPASRLHEWGTQSSTGGGCRGRNCTFGVASPAGRTWVTALAGASLI